MERLSTVILFISPIISVLFIILLLHAEIPLEMSLSFATTNQSTPSSTQSLLTSPNTTDTSNTSAIENATDIFGITKIYPTKQGAREWFLNMSVPTNSSNFSITDNVNLSKVSDGSWRINTTHVRMIVNTSNNQENWNNTEITGYIRLSFPNSSQVSLNRSSTIDSNIFNQSSTSGGEGEGEEIDDLVFISRSGRHSSEIPCDGTAYIGGLHTDGSVGWKKEIWHTGGYTDERARNKIAQSFLDTWIGWKVVVYTIEIDNDTRGVKLESYIDESNSNNWTKVTEFIDGGGWYANTNNSEFFSAGCGKARDHILTDARPNVIFRTDNLVLDFKNLSVREIQPPPFNANWTSVLKLE